MNEPQITLVGYVAKVPLLRVAPSGVPVTDFRLACTPRRVDRVTGEWLDGETLWFGVTCWRALAENVGASLSKGDKVVVSGRLATRSWTGEDGVVRSGLEVEAQSVGVDLSRGTARLQKTSRGSAADDTWATSGDLRPHELAGQSRPLAELVEPDDAHEMAA